MKKYTSALSVLSLLISGGFASSEPVVEQTFPVINERLSDFRIEKCNALRGFGVIHYGSSQTISALSDFCIDTANGKVTGAETRSGFELTEESRRGKSLEILASGRDQNSRVRLSLMQDADSPSPQCVPEGLFSFEYNIPDGKLSHFTNSGYAYSIGYTIPATTQTPVKSETRTVLLSLRNFSQHDLPAKTASATQLPEGADFYGLIKFDEARGRFNISEGGGYWVGDASGGVDLSIGENGELALTGILTAKSQRLKGHEPKEWVTMNVRIPYMRGHILGDDGKQMKSFGFAQGTYVDASGNSHSFRATAQLVACFSL